MRLNHIFIKIFMFLVGIVYYTTTQVNIYNIKHTSQASPLFTFTVDSKIPQIVKLHIGANKSEFISIHCEREKVAYREKGYWWFDGLGEQAIFTLKKGTNSCRALVLNKGKKYTPKIKQKLTFLNYFILFVLIAIPLFSVIFALFVKLLNSLKKDNTFKVIHNVQNQKINSKFSYLILGILFIGMTIRILYFQKFSIMNFQHDWQGHVEFIKEMANHWTLPLPDAGLQFPQQPLYYIISAFVYTIGEQLHMDALQLVGYFSLFCSFIFLVYSYKFVRLLTSNVWTQTVAILFVSFTPSLVYMSAQINNDALVMGLSSLALYYIVKSYQSTFKISFYSAMLWTTLLFLTKISTASIELLFFSLLIVCYFKQEESTIVIRQRLYTFGLIGTMILGFTLLKNYLPLDNTLQMVNSSGNFPGQIIKNLSLSYFGTFNINALIHTGYSYVFGEDSIRFSFLTYQYGTMFFGEFGYNNYIQHHPELKLIMQTILVLGLFYAISMLIFIVKLHKAPLLHKLLFATLLINLMLILKFMLTYSVVCNTDFRYFVSSFLLFAFIFAQGLEILMINRWIQYMIILCITIFAASQLLFFVFLLT